MTLVPAQGGDGTLTSAYRYTDGGHNSRTLIGHTESVPLPTTSR